MDEIVVGRLHASGPQTQGKNGNRTSSLSDWRSRKIRLVEWRGAKLTGMAVDVDWPAVSAAAFSLKTAAALRSGWRQDEHPLDVPGHGHQAPFALDFFQAAQGELP